jgi:hypothetical protein
MPLGAGRVEILPGLEEALIEIRRVDIGPQAGRQHPGLRLRVDDRKGRDGLCVGPLRRLPVVGGTLQSVVRGDRDSDDQDDNASQFESSRIFPREVGQRPRTGRVRQHSSLPRPDNMTPLNRLALLDTLIIGLRAPRQRKTGFEQDTQLCCEIHWDTVRFRVLGLPFE